MDRPSGPLWVKLMLGKARQSAKNVECYRESPGVCAHPSRQRIFSIHEPPLADFGANCEVGDPRSSFSVKIRVLTVLAVLELEYKSQYGVLKGIGLANQPQSRADIDVS